MFIITLNDFVSYISTTQLLRGGKTGQNVITSWSMNPRPSIYVWKH